MILTVDMGNSRIKWAAWMAEKIVARGVAAYAEAGKFAVGQDDADREAGSLHDGDDSMLNVLFTSNGLSPQHGPSRVFAVCVAGSSKQSWLQQWVKKNWQLDVAFLKTQKQYGQVINAYADPSRHGADRWAAVVAAHQLYPGLPVCVLSVGTAITFDLVDRDGEHLGGYILPSYTTMHKALLSDTSNVLSAAGSHNMTTEVPNDTGEAVNSGLHIMLQAGIRELCRSAREQLGKSMKLVVTGGAAKTILRYPGMPEMSHQPDLVMQGLYTIMQNKHIQQG